VVQIFGFVLDDGFELGRGVLFGLDSARMRACSKV
jgi:hypothetical protein